MGSRSVKVEIAGLQLQLRTDADDVRVSSVLSLVRERVDQVREAQSSLSLERALLMAAITLAEEVVRTRDERDASRRAHASLRRDVDEGLQQALLLLDAPDDGVPR